MTGFAFGSQILAQALGGTIQKLENLEGKPKWVGRAELNIEEFFFELDFVEEVLEDFEETEDLDTLAVLSIETDLIAMLPEGAKSLASSTKNPNEIWLSKD